MPMVGNTVTQPLTITWLFFLPTSCTTIGVITAAYTPGKEKIAPTPGPPPMWINSAIESKQPVAAPQTIGRSEDGRPHSG